MRTSDDAVTVPALWLEPNHPADQPVLVFLSEDGFGGEESRLAELTMKGRRVLALDVRGTGETRQHDQQGMTAAVERDYWDIYTAYMLGRSYVGMPAKMLSAVREAQRRSGRRPKSICVRRAV